MKHLLVASFAVSIIAAAVLGQKPPSDRSALFGDWTGESICANNPSCHDEKVIYHISKNDDPDKITIAADKIVDNKPEPMGEIELKYDAVNQTLTGEFQNGRSHGLWEFTVKGNIIEGTLTRLPEKTIVRRIKVQKQESTQKEPA